MREARANFRRDRKKHPASARVTLASVHWTLAGRRNLMTLWHMRRAVVLAKKALVLKGGGYLFNPNQIDVITSILARTPEWLGGDMQLAKRELEYVVENMEMKPDTQALMWCTLGEIYCHTRDKAREFYAYTQAAELLPAIEEEDSDDREEQAIRVRRKVGLYCYDRGDTTIGIGHLRRAYLKACLIAKDQVMKIEAECKSRKIDLTGWCS
jgi:hypothetical protein